MEHTPGLETSPPGGDTLDVAGGHGRPVRNLTQAIFAQFEPALGVLPGGGGAQHLTRLMAVAARSR